MLKAKLESCCLMFECQALKEGAGAFNRGVKSQWGCLAEDARAGGLAALHSLL